MNNNQSSAIQVAVRVRGLTAKEILSNCTDCIEIFENGPQDEQSGESSRNKILRLADKTFGFDYVFGKEHTQKDVYLAICTNLLQNFLQGFNATILAYGQTGSGKTFSMGTGLEHDSTKEDDAGIVPRTINALFESLKANPKKYQVCVSFLELYNEELFDLLNPSTLSAGYRPSTGAGGALAASSANVNANTQPLQIREDGSGGLVWKGATEKVCESAEQVMFHLQQGSLCRATGSTDMNATSSRSHAIFCATLRQFLDDGSTIISKFNFVDLAGSERLKRTKAEGDRAKEGIAINAGLLALGNVISALADEARHIPYRDSKLTRILQDSLGGNSLTAMLACVSPSDSNIGESINTLRYADRAKSVKNRAIINTEFFSNPSNVRELEKENKSLRALVDTLRAQIVLGDSSLSAPGLAEGKTLLFCEQQQRQLDLNKEQTRQIAQDLGTMRAKVEMASAELARLKKVNKKVRKMAIASETRVKSLELELCALREHDPTLSPDKEKRMLEQLGQQKITELEATIVCLKDQLEFQKSLANTKILHRNSSGNLALSDAESASDDDDELDVEADGGEDDAQVDDKDLLNSSLADIFRDVDNTLNDNQTDMLRELHQLQQDITLKEDLVQSLEKSQAEYNVMRQRYEEKLHLLQATLALAEQERDRAMKRAFGQKSSETREQISEKYQEKIKKLGKEIEIMKKRYEAASKSTLEKQSQNEQTLKTMRINIESLKNEKVKLVRQLHQESQKLKKVVQRNDIELQKLKRKERATSQLANKLLAANKAQLALLERRSEQVLFTRKENRQLKSVMAVLKKQKTAKTISKKSPRRNPVRLNSRRSQKPTVLADEQTGNVSFTRNIIDVELKGCVQGLLAKGKLDGLLYKRYRCQDERKELLLEREQILALQKEKAADTSADGPQYMDERLSEIESEVADLNSQITVIKEQLLNKGFATFLSSYYGSAFVFDAAHVVSNVLAFDHMHAPISISDLNYFGFQNACHLVRSLPAEQMEQVVEYYLSHLVELEVQAAKNEAHLASLQLKSRQMQKAILSNSLANSANVKPRAVSAASSDNAPGDSSALGLVSVVKAEDEEACGWKATADFKRQKTDSESNKSNLTKYQTEPSISRSKSDGNIKEILQSVGGSFNFFTCPTSPSHSPVNQQSERVPRLAEKPVLPEIRRPSPTKLGDGEPQLHTTRSGTVFNSSALLPSLVAPAAETPTIPSLPAPEASDTADSSLQTLAGAFSSQASLSSHPAVTVYDRLSTTHTVSSLQKVRESISVIRGAVVNSIDLSPSSSAN